MHRPHLPLPLITNRAPAPLAFGLPGLVVALCVRVTSSSPQPPPLPRPALVVLSAPLPSTFADPNRHDKSTTHKQAEAWRTAAAATAAPEAAATTAAAPVPLAVGMLIASSSPSGRPINSGKAPSPPRTPPLLRLLYSTANGMAPPPPHFTNNPPALSTHLLTGVSSTVPPAGLVATSPSKR